MEATQRAIGQRAEQAADLELGLVDAEMAADVDPEAVENDRIISSEVLPLPEGPTTAVTSPLFTVRLTSLRICSMDLPLISSRLAFSVWMTGEDISGRTRGSFGFKTAPS